MEKAVKAVTRYGAKHKEVVTGVADYAGKHLADVEDYGGKHLADFNT